MISDAYGNTRFYGVYRGVVFDTNDPLKKNRIRVQVPQLLAGEATTWAWPVGLVGAIPKVGEGVFIQFESGDPIYPLWSGSFTDNLVGTSSTQSSTTTTVSVGTPSIIDGGSA